MVPLTNDGKDARERRYRTFLVNSITNKMIARL